MGRQARKYLHGPIEVGPDSRPAGVPARHWVHANEGFRPRLLGPVSGSRRDPTFCAVDAWRAHGAAKRGIHKYPNGPVQPCVVSRPARVSARHRVRAKQRSLENTRAWGRTAQDPIYIIRPAQVDMLSRLAHPAARHGLRTAEGFRPSLRGRLSRSRRDLAICAVQVLNANGTAQRRTRFT